MTVLITSCIFDSEASVIYPPKEPKNPGPDHIPPTRDQGFFCLEFMRADLTVGDRGRLAAAVEIDIVP